MWERREMNICNSSGGAELGLGEEGIRLVQYELCHDMAREGTRP